MGKFVEFSSNFRGEQNFTIFRRKALKFANFVELHSHYFAQYCKYLIDSILFGSWKIRTLLTFNKDVTVSNVSNELSFLSCSFVVSLAAALLFGLSCCRAKYFSYATLCSRSCSTSCVSNEKNNSLIC